MTTCKDFIISAKESMNEIDLCFQLSCFYCSYFYYTGYLLRKYVNILVKIVYLLGYHFPSSISLIKNPFKVYSAVSSNY